MAPGANYMGGKRNAARMRSKDTVGRAQKHFFSRQRIDVFSKGLSGRASSIASTSGLGPKATASDIDLSHARHQPDASIRRPRDDENTAAAPEPFADESSHPKHRTPSPRIKRGKMTHTRTSSGSRSSRVLEALDTTEPVSIRAALSKILSIPDLAGLSTHVHERSSPAVLCGLKRPLARECDAQEGERTPKKPRHTELSSSFKQHFEPLDLYDTPNENYESDDDFYAACNYKTHTTAAGLQSSPSSFTVEQYENSAEERVHKTTYNPLLPTEQTLRKSDLYPTVSLSSHSADFAYGPSLVMDSIYREAPSRARPHRMVLRENLYDYEDPWNAIGVILGLEEAQDYARHAQRAGAAPLVDYPSSQCAASLAGSPSDLAGSFDLPPIEDHPRASTHDNEVEAETSSNFSRDHTSSTLDVPPIVTLQAQTSSTPSRSNEKSRPTPYLTKFPLTPTRANSTALHHASLRPIRIDAKLAEIHKSSTNKPLPDFPRPYLKHPKLTTPTVTEIRPSPPALVPKFQPGDALDADSEDGTSYSEAPRHSSPVATFRLARSFPPPRYTPPTPTKSNALERRDLAGAFRIQCSRETDGTDIYARSSEEEPANGAEIERNGFAHVEHEIGSTANLEQLLNPPNRRSTNIPSSRRQSISFSSPGARPSSWHAQADQQLQSHPPSHPTRFSLTRSSPIGVPQRTTGSDPRFNFPIQKQRGFEFPMTLPNNERRQVRFASVNGVSSASRYNVASDGDPSSKPPPPAPLLLPQIEQSLNPTDAEQQLELEAAIRNCDGASSRADDEDSARAADTHVGQPDGKISESERYFGDLRLNLFADDDNDGAAESDD